MGFDALEGQTMCVGLRNRKRMEVGCMRAIFNLNGQKWQSEGKVRDLSMKVCTFGFWTVDFVVQQTLFNGSDDAVLL